MTPETWAGLGIVAGGIVTALGKSTWDKRKSGNGSQTTHLSKRIDELSEKVEDLDEKVGSMAEDVAFIRGRLEPNR